MTTVTRDPLDYSWWLLSRSAGVVALLAFSLTVALGIHLAVRGRPRRPGLAAVIRALHEHLALAGLIALGIHAVALLGDPWLRPGLTGILVPLAIDYRPLWVAAGIVGAFVLLVGGLSAYARRRLGPARQRVVHRLTLLGWALGVVHTLGAGTDAGSVWLRAIVLLPALPVVYGLVLRVTNPARPAPRARPAS